MSWLDDKEHTAKFVCRECGHEFFVPWPAKDWPPPAPQLRWPEGEVEDIPHKCMAEDLVYSGMEPYQMGGLTRITFNKDGVEAIRIVDSKGAVTHRAKSKETYLEKGIVTDSGTGPRPHSLADNTPKYSTNSRHLK